MNGVPHSLEFSGTGVDPVLVSATRFDFGEVEVRATAPSQSVTLTNVARVPVTLSLAGGAAGEFGGTTSCGSSLAPGASCTALLRVQADDDGPGVTKTATLAVNGVSYSLEFSGTGVPAGSAPSAQFLVTPTRFAFGGVQVGGTAPSQSVTLTNVGSSPAPVNLAGGGAGVFGGATDCAGRTLDPGKSCSISYAFRPTALGAAARTATFTAAGTSHTLDFSGTGFDPVLVTPTRFAFGEVVVGQTAPSQSVTLTNVGATPAPVGLAGGGAGEFGGATDCAGRTLDPGTSCTVSYAFTPTTTGPLAKTVTLPSNGVSHSLDFSGTGVGPRFLVTPTELSFGTHARRGHRARPGGDGDEHGHRGRGRDDRGRLPGDPVHLGAEL